VVRRRGTRYPERDLGWIFSRSPDMDDALYQQLIRKMRDHGVNARQLVREPQLPSQVGKPGFAEPKNP
jgi:apolipoprotein D and lipocalin family protein